MCLGTLATIAGLEKPARNFYLFVCHNGTYEVTGNQHIPGRSGFSFSTIAQGWDWKMFMTSIQPNRLTHHYRIF